MFLPLSTLYSKGNGDMDPKLKIYVIIIDKFFWILFVVRTNNAEVLGELLYDLI